uniref:Uncharacterized protein n=1 Tax=Arundo donax TaxID=35708 RepID=A0A0A9BZ31_ARUDO
MDKVVRQESVDEIHLGNAVI